MAISFDLVQALNNTGTGGLAVFGAFRVGTYNNNNPLAFNVFNIYAYTNNTVATPPYDNTLELAWYTYGNSRPHIGIENINGNTNINSLLWGESIYWHPGGSGTWNDNTNRPCVIRFTSPVNTTLSASGIFTKGDSPLAECVIPANVSFMIKKNGVDIIARDPAGIGPGAVVPITLSNISVLAGDTIDFILDNGFSGTCRDSAITLEVTLENTITPTPVPNSTPLNCTDTTVSGTIQLAQSGTVSVYAPDGTTLLGTSLITPISGTVNGQWSVSGLNLNNYGNQSLQITALDSPSTVSLTATKFVGNSNCISCTAPVVTTHPSSNPAVCVGDGHTMIVTATGTAPLSYQWKLGGLDISGETTDTYTATSAGSYTVTVTNACGSITSNAAIVTIANPPSVVSGGVFPDATEGTAYSHSIVLAGNLPIAIVNSVIPSWMTASIAGNTVTLSGTPGPSDVTTDIYVLVELQNVCDSIILNEPIDVISSCISVGGGTISGSSEVAVFAPNTYSVSGLTGTGPFTYLWSVPASGGIISGQGTTSISAQFSTLGNVSVEVTNCGGSFNKTINFPVSIFTGNAVDDTAITTANTPVVINLSANDILC